MKFFPIFFLSFLCFNSVSEAKFSLGIDYLEETNFGIIKGKKVGLLTHPAGKNGNGKSTVEVLRSTSQVDLVALFGPEHGIYGDEKAAVPVEDKIDQKTGLPVFSLYGKFRKPTANMLAKIDCLVIDLQDVGVRCYTYISCMRYAMEACFEEGVQVVVLDRPNPLGGFKMAGPMIDKKWMSYVGAFPMPFVHGMTIGEIALWSKKETGILKISEKARKEGQLAIVPMKNWSRNMTWPGTGLKWIPTSPNIPTLDSVAGYPMTGLGAQMGKFKHGIGTPQPFRFLTYEGKTPTELKNAVGNKIGQKGKEFGTVTNRKRRCGWFDAVLVKQSCTISGTKGIALTKIDVLDEIKDLYICVAYKINGKKIDYFPSSLQDQIKVKPVYKRFNGWLKNTSGIKKWKDLPMNAKKYITFIKNYCDVEISSISTSPKREDTILLKNPFIK